MSYSNKVSYVASFYQFRSGVSYFSMDKLGGGNSQFFGAFSFDENITVHKKRHAEIY